MKILQKATTFIHPGQRESQEDHFLINDMALAVANGKGRLLAVMDGHCGDTIGLCLHDHIVTSFSQSLFLCDGDISATLRRIFKELDVVCVHETCGSSLSVVYIPVDDSDDDTAAVYCAYMGDSPIVVFDRDGKLQSSHLHNVEHAEFDILSIAEKHAAKIESGELSIEERYLSIGSRYLQLTRSIGDRHFGDVLIREPELHTFTANRKSIVMLATDGILVQNNIQQLYQHLIGMAGRGDTAREMGEWVLNQHAFDNTTIVLQTFQ